MTDHIFLYGTLLPRLAPASIRPTVARLRQVGRGWLSGALYDLGPYPGAVFSVEATRVWGVVFELPDDPAVLAALDDYEGYVAHDEQGSLFTRVRSTATIEAGGRLECWGYVYNRETVGLRLIASGDYLAYRGISEPADR